MSLEVLALTVFLEAAIFVGSKFTQALSRPSRRAISKLL